MTAPLLDARNVSRSFGHHPAVREIGFTLERGEFLTVFGPNGAGKTTLLRMLAGLLRPSSGEIRIAGELMDHGAHGWRRRIGVLSHQTFLYGRLTARENLRFYARLYDVPEPAARIDDVLDTVGLTSRADDRVSTYSRGMQQRLALARTLLHDPELVLLDEPYTGLDPHAARMLKGVLSHLRDGRRTVMLVTHNISQGLELADRVAVQVSGRWVSDEPVSAIDRAGFEHVYTQRVGGVA